jgi:hypothetical protein
MKRVLHLPIVMAISACSVGHEQLLVTRLDIPEPRSALEQSIKKNGMPEFVYFDRAHHDLYVLGLSLPDFQFRIVNIRALRSQKPDIAKIISCTTSHQCSFSDYKRCQATVPLNNRISEQDENDIVNTMRSRGYPLLGMTFNIRPNSPEMADITYFSECQFIRSDVIENFPIVFKRSALR